MRALVAGKDADFQTLESVWRPSSQMRVAAAVFTAKRSNKFQVLHKGRNARSFMPNPLTCWQKRIMAVVLKLPP
jgi:hypothetical protein